MSENKNLSKALNVALLLTTVLIGYGLTMWLDNTRPPAKQEVIAMPEFAFTDLEGNTHKSNDFKGKIVLINFWASWCAPCVVEFPALLNAAAKNPDDVVLIALSWDKGEDEVRKFLQNQKVPGDNVLIGLDTADIAAKFGTTSLPETIVIDHDLNRREKLIGAAWEPETLQKIIDSLRE